MLEIGVAREDITIVKQSLGMMGWAMLHNVVKDARTALHARAFVLRDPDAKSAVAMVCCEIALISTAIKQGVCERLRTDHAHMGLDIANVMLMATHTHSGPGGISHYPFYNVTIPGFAPDVCDHIIDGIVRAIESAWNDRVSGTVRLGTGEFEPELEVGFNRSIKAYNLNPDVQPVTEDERHLAINREMTLLRFDDERGRPLGSINWFGVHCTSVHSDNTSLHFDNKGYAAQLLEREVAASESLPEFVGAFAQGTAGDVTPNFRYHSGKPWMRGKYVDDDESARYNGEIQGRKALEVWRDAGAGADQADLGYAHMYVDFSNLEVDPRDADGQHGRRTGPAEIGMSMFFGTEEGPGLPRSLLFMQNVLGNLRPAWRRLARRSGGDEVQGEKVTWVETGRRRLLGLSRIRRLPLPWRLHPSLRLVRELEAREQYSAKPWTPNVLPVQLFVIGPLAIAAVPAEFTTTSGRRLCAAVGEALKDRGVTHVALAGYSNAYAGYVTTAQEYSLQDYEGASTHFGKWTQAAYVTQFRALAEQLLDSPHPLPGPTGLQPPHFTDEELAIRQFPA